MEIEPCKRCGGQAVIMKLNDKYAVECMDCWFYSNRKFKTRELAIEYWNKGAPQGYNLMCNKSADA